MPLYLVALVAVASALGVGCSVKPGDTGIVGAKGDPGVPGAPGQSISMSAIAPSDARCAQGGVVLATGGSSAVLCNGTDLTSPSGTVVAFAGVTPPPGWLVCDGNSVDRAEHPRLFAAIGTSWGTVDSSSFNLPDLRGRFVRGVDLGAGHDPDAVARTTSSGGGNSGDAVGTLQGDALQAHTHVDTGHYHDSDTVSPIGGGSSRNGYALGNGLYTYNDPRCVGCTFHIASANLGNPTNSGTGAGVPRLAAESRPTNAAMVYIIKD